MDIRKRAQEIAPEIIEIRRDLHRHPEVSGKEFRTTGKICEKLEELGIPFRKLEPTGVIADIHGAAPENVKMPLWLRQPSSWHCRRWSAGAWLLRTRLF